MKIFDCFPFFNELELLHLRLLEYADKVDYFVLVEATRSHTGKEKPLIFEANKERFKEYLPQIIHVVVEDLPIYSVSDIWKAENFQRNCILRGLSNAKRGDKIIVSDCDELWDPRQVKRCLSRTDYVTFTQDLYYYYVNCLQNQKWNGPIIATYGNMGSPQDLRNIARAGYNCIYPGGWHYSFMGGAQRIKEKVDNIAESHLIISDVGSVQEIEQKMQTQTDLWNRTEEYAQKQLVDISQSGKAPKCINEFLKLYPDFYFGNK